MVVFMKLQMFTMSGRNQMQKSSLKSPADKVSLCSEGGVAMADEQRRGVISSRFYEVSSGCQVESRLVSAEGVTMKTREEAALTFYVGGNNRWTKGELTGLDFPM